MKDSITKWLTMVSDPIAREAIRAVCEAMGDRFSSQAMTGAGLVIKAGGGVLAKTGGSTTHLLVQGKYVSIAAATDMPALTGLTITANKFNIVCFFVDLAGTTSVKWGIEGATAKDVKWPEFPKNKALIGALLITHSSTFTGNTTPLDTATTVYISPTGVVDPSVLI